MINAFGSFFHFGDDDAFGPLDGLGRTAELFGYLLLSVALQHVVQHLPLEGDEVDGQFFYELALFGGFGSGEGVGQVGVEREEFGPLAALAVGENTLHCQTSQAVCCKG